MIHREAQAVDARWLGRFFAGDRDLSFPDRPRLIPEVLVLPFREDGLLFVGAESPQVIRGRSARSLLPKVLPLLDGRRRLEEVAIASGISASTLRDVVILLFSRGLLEDATAGEAEVAELAELSSFLGRFNDVSRCNRNRTEALARLAQASVRVLGPADYAAKMAADLRTSGFGAVEVGGENGGVCDVCVLISTDDENVREDMLDKAARAGRRLMLLRLGATEAHVGPIFMPGFTSCPRCFTRLHPHPKGVPDTDLAQYWTALGALQIFHAVSKVGPGRMQQEFRIVRLESSGELVQEARLSPRTPGCTGCGIPDSPLPPYDARLLAWLYHSATTLAPRELLSPKDHQTHYLISNLKLAADAKPRLFHGRTVALPEPLPLSAQPPWIRAAPPAPAPSLDLPSLATLLARAAGEVQQEGRHRRVAPTGGNLGSIDLWVAARNTPGLRRGVYHYDAPRHQLEWSTELREPSLGAALNASEFSGDLIVGTSDLARCARKYQGFAYRLVQFDSGVALAYLYCVAAQLGLAVSEFPDYNEAGVADLLGVPHRWEFPLPAFVVAVGVRQLAVWSVAPVAESAERVRARLVSSDYSSELLQKILEQASGPVTQRTPQPLVRHVRRVPPLMVMESLDAALLARRAVRDFAPRPIRRAILVDLLRLAADFLQKRLGCGAPRCFVRPVLAVARGDDHQPEGLYELDCFDGRLIKRAAFGLEAMHDCINQSSLAEAAAAIITVADLGATLAERGVRGYREQAQHAGAAIGQAWLAATAYGLVGCAAGGVIPSGLRVAAGMDGFCECPLLTLHIGHAPDS